MHSFSIHNEPSNVEYGIWYYIDNMYSLLLLIFSFTVFLLRLWTHHIVIINNKDDKSFNLHGSQWSHTIYLCAENAGLSKGPHHSLLPLLLCSSSVMLMFLCKTRGRKYYMKGIRLYVHDSDIFSLLRLSVWNRAYLAARITLFIPSGTVHVTDTKTRSPSNNCCTLLEEQYHQYLCHNGQPQVKTSVCTNLAGF